MTDVLEMPTLREEWRDEGLCNIAAETDPMFDPDIFYPEGKPGYPAYDRQVEVAKKICKACPVVAQCLAWAVESRQEHGVWGGTEESERIDFMRTASREGLIKPPSLRTNTEVSQVIAGELETRDIQLKKIADADKARLRARNVS